MMRLVIVACLTNLVFSYYQFSGVIEEFTGMPITLQCSYELGYIQIGGITVNGKIMSNELQEKVKNQCEKKMDKYEKALIDISKKPQGKDVGDDDELRVVYKCLKAKTGSEPEWGEEVQTEEPSKKKTVSIEVLEDGELTCDRKNEIITIDVVRLNGQETTIARLQPEKLTESCYQKWINLVKGGNADYPLCVIQNDVQQSVMEIDYYCLGPGQAKIQIGQGNGNGNGKGKGKGNGNGNGNGNDNGIHNVYHKGSNNGNKS